MSDSKTVIAVQASLVSWEGGSDICANIWDGKPVIEHTLERVQHELPNLPIWLLVPDIPENKPLEEVAKKLNANIVFGPFDDVVTRFCMLPNNVDSVIRLIGMHPFFSVELAKDIMDTREKDPSLDVVLPPENMDVQFTVGMFSLPALRAIAHDVSNPKLRIDPLRFLCDHKARNIILQDVQYDNAPDREQLRQLARQIYQDDVLHADQSEMKQELTENSQIFGHYRLAFDFAKEQSQVPTESVLDIGGALGFRRTLQEKSQFPLDYRVIDIDPDKISQGKSLDPETKFICGNCYELPFSDNTFDMVFACEIIEHLEQPEKLLDEALRVVKKGGFVAISTPQNRSGNKPLNPNHLFEFTLDEFSTFCNRVDAEITYFTFFSGLNFADGLKTGNNMMCIFQKH